MNPNRTRIRRVISPFDIDNEIADRIRETTLIMEELPPLTRQDLMFDRIQTIQRDVFPQIAPSFYQSESEAEPSFYQDLPYDEEAEFNQDLPYDEGFNQINRDVSNLTISPFITPLSSLPESLDSWFE